MTSALQYQYDSTIRYLFYHLINFNTIFLISGKSSTMIGTAESVGSLGVVPNAISWLYRCITEQKQKTGARFSVRVSAVEVGGPSCGQVNDLLAHQASGKQTINRFII